MKAEIAKEIFHNLNSPKIIDTIKSYALARIEILRVEFEACKDADRIRQIQGSMQELRKLMSIREDALNVYNREMNRNG